MRSVLRLMPSHSAARLWLPSACVITTSSSGFSTTLHDHLVHRRRARRRAGPEVALQAVAHALFDVFLAHASLSSLIECVALSSWHRRPARRAACGRMRVGQRVEPVGDGARPARRRSRSRSSRRGTPSPPGSAAHVPADVLARAAHAGVLAVQARSGRAGARAASALHLGAPAAARSCVAGGEEVRDLAKDPGPALRGAADHHRVGAGAREHLARLLAASRCRRWRPPGSRTAAFTAAMVSYSASPL